VIYKKLKQNTEKEKLRNEKQKSVVMAGKALFFLP